MAAESTWIKMKDQGKAGSTRARGFSLPPNYHFLIDTSVFSTKPEEAKDTQVHWKSLLKIDQQCPKYNFCVQKMWSLMRLQLSLLPPYGCFPYGWVDLGTMILWPGVCVAPHCRRLSRCGCPGPCCVQLYPGLQSHAGRMVRSSLQADESTWTLQDWGSSSFGLDCAFC